ncbi:Myeloid protein 1 [Lonchura striata]|uniref:Myeloid protein 1 n=1 Tax=Lonchura striata TaxID=40157 RepID=A0A218V3Y3_9PASE|nr:Myeloid protein 1 [Lonchura striata domestica]
MAGLSLVTLVSLVSTVFTKQLDAHPPQQQHRHWAQLCSGNPTNRIRGCDRYGCGNFGADRQSSKEKHMGVDVICSDGATVYAPFSGQLSGPIRFFHNGNAIDDGVQIMGEGKRNGKGKHRAVDVICADGATVYAPFSGQLSGPIKFFHNGNAIDDGVQIRGPARIPTFSLPSLFYHVNHSNHYLIFMITVFLLFCYFHYCYLSGKDKTDIVNISEM